MPYIFGYGSLIEKASRLRTTPSAVDVLPARARGYVRGWWARTANTIGFTTTFLGAIAEQSSSVNGVIYFVSDAELVETNKRESGYTPTDITSAVEMIAGAKPTDKIWIYLNKFDPGVLEKSLPTAEFPIVESYVDICLTGCLQVEEGFPEAKDFAKEFITSTQKWSKYWENDRVNPRRPFVSVPKASTIDALLKDHLPTQFAEIQLAPGRWGGESSNPFG